MTNIFLEAVSDTLEELGLEPLPISMLKSDDYGSDLYCADDLEPDMLEVSGDSTEAVSLALYRRLITPRGALADDPNYGFDLRGLLSNGMTNAKIASIPGMIRNELLKDDRVDSVVVEPTYTASTATLDLKIKGNSSSGPFELTLSATDKTTLLESIK